MVTLTADQPQETVEALRVDRAGSNRVDNLSETILFRDYLRTLLIDP